MAKFRMVDHVQAWQLTAWNQHELERVSGGDIKGTKLHPAHRELELLSDGEELRAKVTDWIVRLPDGRRWLVMTDEAFKANFERP